MTELKCKGCDYSCSNDNCLAKQAHEAFKVIIDYAYKLQKEQKSKNRKKCKPTDSEKEDEDNE